MVNFSSQCTLRNIKLNKTMPPFERPPPQKPFKQRKTFATRKLEVAGIRSKFPTKIPVIIERYQREKFLPPLDKTKFLVPQELSMTQFVTIIRNRMCLMPSQAFYLLINNSGLASMSLTMAQVYKDHKDDDGFLYMTYASQEMFGDSIES
ncbi:microtubule-associated proteins 1A/1B light chain 3C [Hypomesus transpacificus]|uniref:microtubule-associated proteins 1A/1B light chain 3C n=1 Tax=Hypomesus transpacificus TaxID=137520 RepID=UPI001F0788C0|nr:microtubule-associated proteins 1A/1B light chain 3C [Hypomesus transpacificus]